MAALLLNCLGRPITLKARSPAGFAIKEWQAEDGGVIGTGDTIQLTMDADPNSPDQMDGMIATVESVQVNGSIRRHFIFRVLPRINADDLRVLLETSSNLLDWNTDQPVFLGRQREINSPTEWLRFRSAVSVSEINASYVRLRIRQWH